MKNLLTLIVLIVCVSFSNELSAQYVITGIDYDQSSPLNCGALPAGPNFSDGMATYSPNMDEVVTYCPDLAQGSKVSIAFATNIGYTFDIDPTDTIYIYDGPNTSAPLLGAYNSATNPSGFYVEASFQNNPSGCLTVRFVSDGSSELGGWDAHLGCGNLPQPYEPHIEAYINGVGGNALNPLDTGYVDVCFGDSILFIAKPTFPYALEATGTGYSQTVNNCSFQWTIGAVGNFPNDSVWFKPPQRSGYFVDLRVTDIFPQIKRITCKVRVSQLPSFAGTGPEKDTVCLGQNTYLIGGVTPTDTVGIDIPFGQFEVGGIFAGLTPLPDGNNSVYQAPVSITGFDAGATITSGSDIETICIDIEHSYIGDIEIALTCPNGTQVSLMNAYNGATGLIPGGCGNGISQSLGNDTDIDGGAPGANPWTYCFSVQNATNGTMCDEIAANNFITNSYGDQSLNNAGVFLPDGNFDNFIGCPVNGNWSITVKDNQAIDDGYIFQWGIYFNASLYPDGEGYQNIVVTENWLNDPTIVSGQNDTLIVIQPNTPGSYSYTYVITDDFGCTYDTTVALFVQPQPTIFTDTIGCYYNYYVNGTTSYNGGIWSAADTAIHFSPAANVENPLIYTSTPGRYVVTYTDNACNTAVTAEIYFPDYPWTDLPDTTICEGSVLVLNAPNYNADATEYVWSNGLYGPNIELSEPGFYEVTLSNVCHSSTNSFNLGVMNCFLDAPNVISLANGSLNSIWYPDSYGIKDYEIVITNRWGNVVFKCDDNINLCNWNGKDMSGAFVEEGTYFYLINAKTEGDEEIQKHGFIQVVK